MPVSERWKKTRRWVSHKLWNVASHVWVAPPDEDRSRHGYFSMDCTYHGTEAEADRLFEALGDLGHNVLALHESDSRFVVGGMRWVEDESGAEQRARSERPAGYAYRTQLQVDVYFRAIDNNDALEAQARLAEAVESALAEEMEVDGAKVNDRRLFAERGYA